MNKKRSYDVTIIGGGPTGSTVGSYLAQRGYRVAILEQEKFPRYSVGESMLPFCYFPLEEIGIIEKVKASSFVQKNSVQFIRPDGESSLPFYFFQHMNHEAATTWQVEREEFDQLLLNHARNSGVEVIQPAKVKGFITNDGGKFVGVKARDPTGNLVEFESPMTVDASGQASIAALRNGWRIKDNKLRKIAIWTYYEGAKRDSGYDAGATTIAYLEDKNWIWYIPLQNDKVSVGVVGNKEYLYKEGRESCEIFKREIRKNQWIQDHLQHGKRISEFRVTGDISYRSKYSAANGLILSGDAFAFLDPVFSSGLFLALHGGVLAGKAIDNALKENNFAPSQFMKYSEELSEAIETMRKLVYAFYDPHFSFGNVIRKYPQLHADLTDCLIGNLNKDFTFLFHAISEFIELPAPLEYGRPLVHSP